MANKRSNKSATTADVVTFFADYPQHGVAYTCPHCPHISTVGQFDAYAGTCAGCGQTMRPEAWKRSEMATAGPVPVFVMSKFQNRGIRGARYSYRVQIDGKTQTYEDNRDYVAAIISRAEILTRPGKFIYSLNYFTGKASQLGKALTAGGRSRTFVIALIETVRVAGENRVLVRSSSGNYDGQSIDWTELPPEFRRGPSFNTLINDPNRVVVPITIPAESSFRRQ